MYGYSACHDDATSLSLRRHRHSIPSYPLYPPTSNVIHGRLAPTLSQLILGLLHVVTVQTILD